MTTQALRFGQTFTLFALLVIFTSPAQASESNRSERPCFSGTWQLNEEMSENPRDKMKESMGSRRGGMGGGMGGGRMGGGMGGGRGGGMGRGMGGGKGGGRGGMGGDRGGDREEMRARMQAIEEGIRRLEIDHEDAVLTIRYDSGAEQAIYTDGRSFEMENPMGEVVEATAKWKKNERVVVKMDTEHGGRITEIYELVPVAHQERLFVTVELPGNGPMPSIEFRRVYDPVATESEPY